MNTVTIKDVGIVTIPERNTKEEIIHIVDQMKKDSETLHKMFIIKPIEVFWCEHWTCIETIDPFNSEEELQDHICKCHKINCSDFDTYKDDVITFEGGDESDEEHMKWRDEEDAIQNE